LTNIGYHIVQAAERGMRGESPGALTFGERLHRRWLSGRAYGARDLADRYVRGRSLSRVDLASSGISSAYLVR